ncbi:MAG: FtsQ-type POTRA domain-containing protein [Vicinamibacterales bacterium]|nr:FtsQ-type POTRA domain-containing protein [Vicinamibacterales bacterium]
MSVTVPSDRRFLRSNARPTRHTRLRARWWWQLIRSTAILGAMAFGGYEAALFAVAAPSLSVRHIVLEGNRRLSEGEARALLDGLRGENVLSTDLERWRERLRASSWVADAELRRRLPATIVVRIVERDPVGIARLGHELFLVDANGGVIDEYGPRYADCDLPIIDGLLVRGAQGSRVDESRARLIADMMTDIRRRPDMAQRVSQIDVADPLDLRVILDGDPAVLRLGDTRFLERIWSYVGLQDALRQQVPDMDYVDLRFDDRVYVGPAAVVARNAHAGAGAVTPDAPARRP